MTVDTVVVNIAVVVSPGSRVVTTKVDRTVVVKVAVMVEAGSEEASAVPVKASVVGCELGVTGVVVVERGSEPSSFSILMAEKAGSDDCRSPTTVLKSMH